MPINDFEIADLPQLDDVPAAFGAFSAHNQITEPMLFDIIVTVVIATNGK